MTGPSLPAPPPVQSAAKAVAASLTTLSGWVALLVTSVADGSISWDESGKLIGAAVAAVATIYAVWRTPNKPKVN